MKNIFEGQQVQNRVIDGGYEAMAELDKKVQELDPLTLDNFLSNSLCAANEAGDAQSLVGVVQSLDLSPSTIEGFSLEESMAAVRDLNMIFSSLRRHNYNFEKDKKIEQALIFLANKTNEVPTDTVFSYGTRNPQGERMRTFTSLPEERLFIGSFREGMVHLPAAIKALEGVGSTPLDNLEFSRSIKQAQIAFEEMVAAIVKVRRNISPELFTHKLRPFFEPKTVKEKKYQAPGGAQMPIVLIDQLIWGSKVVDTMYQEYFNENVQYLPSFLTEKALTFSRIESLISRVKNELIDLSKLDAEALKRVEESLMAILSLLSFIEKFRIPHMRIAEENMKIRSSGSVGSGGYDTAILKFLLDNITSAKKIINNELELVRKAIK